MADTTIESSGEVVFQGIGVSPGVAVGEAVVFSPEARVPPERHLSADEIPNELVRLSEALAETRHQLASIRRQVLSALGEQHAGIFDAHLLVVEDRGFIGEIEEGIRRTKRNAEAVLIEVSNRYIDVLSKVGDDYLSERAADVRDVVRRMMKNLTGGGIDRLGQIDRPCIAVARDFSPSDTAGMDRKMVHALVADLGSSTSHTAIMARALEVPAVVGLHEVSSQVVSGDTMVVDGGKGTVVIRPTPQRLLEYAQRAEDHKTILCELETLRDKPSETLDGYYVPIAANIELPSELHGVGRHGARGVGLFRSEFLFIENDHLPDEDEQTAVYANAADQCAPENVVIRTLDLGGDKFASSVKVAPEMNPFLGWRAIRFCLAHPAFFKTQLRAVLRAGHGRNLSLMYPMISSSSEVVEANRLLDECRSELAREGIAFAERLPVGAMIEVPSAALTAELIAPHVDFFSIGTNDLVQYTLAVDRVNEQVAHLYKPTHLSIIRLIRKVVLAGHARRIPVAVCGQMAATPDLVPLLIGLGVDELSISPPAIPMIKDVIRNLHYSECRTLAKRALGSSDSADIRRQCRGLLEKRAPEVLELLN